MVLERPPKPLVSQRAQEPELGPRIDSFVIRLGEVIDFLQDAAAEPSVERLAARAGELAQEARELGYEPMAVVAERIVAACQEGSAEAAHKSVVDATELAQRIRRGHHTCA